MENIKYKKYKKANTISLFLAAVLISAVLPCLLLNIQCGIIYLIVWLIFFITMSNTISTDEKCVCIANRFLPFISKRYEFESIGDVDVEPDKVFYSKTLLIRIQEIGNDSWKKHHLGYVSAKDKDMLTTALKQSLNEKNL